VTLLRTAAQIEKASYVATEALKGIQVLRKGHHHERTDGFTARLTVTAPPSSRTEPTHGTPGRDSRLSVATSKRVPDESPLPALFGNGYFELFFFRLVASIVNPTLTPSAAPSATHTPISPVADPIAAPMPMPTAVHPPTCLAFIFPLGRMALD